MHYYSAHTRATKEKFPNIFFMRPRWNRLCFAYKYSNFELCGSIFFSYFLLEWKNTGVIKYISITEIMYVCKLYINSALIRRSKKTQAAGFLRAKYLNSKSLFLYSWLFFIIIDSWYKVISGGWEKAISEKKESTLVYRKSRDIGFLKYR